MAHAYLVTNVVANRPATSFVWTTGGTTNRLFLSDGRMDKLFSPGSTTEAGVIIDLGSAKSVSALAILNTNLAASAPGTTVRIRAADATDMTGNLVTLVSAGQAIAVTAPRQKDHVFQFAATTRRAWEITFTYNATINLTIGDIVAGASVPLTRGTVFGPRGEAEEYVNTNFKGYSGETRGHYIAGPYRTKTLPFSDLSEAERDELLTMFRAAKGSSTPLLWIENYTAAASSTLTYQDCIWGRLGEDVLKWMEVDYGRYEPAALSIRSLAREVGA